MCGTALSFPELAGTIPNGAAAGSMKARLLLSTSKHKKTEKIIAAKKKELNEFTHLQIIFWPEFDVR